MRVAIVALGPSSQTYMRLAEGMGDVKKLFDETWCVNGYSNVFQCDRGFAMDSIVIQAMRGKNGNRKIANMVDALRRHPGPVYTSRKLRPMDVIKAKIEELKSKTPAEEIEKALIERQLAFLETEKELVAGGGFEGLVEFPLEAVVNSCGRDYANSTVAYPIMLAIHEGATEIGMFGADYTYPNKHIAERGRACCEYWLGVASARGIKVGISKDSGLMDANETVGVLYGYDTVSVKREFDKNGYCRITFDEPQWVPSAAEIEKRYDKGFNMTGNQNAH